MSAWVVSKEHIDVLVWALVACGINKAGSEDETGRILWSENRRSVRHLYQRRPTGRQARERWTYAYTPPASSLSLLGGVAWLGVRSESSPMHMHGDQMRSRTAEACAVACDWAQEHGIALHLYSLDTIAHVAKQLDCYEYQSSEHPGWYRSEAFTLCNRLRRELLNLVPGFGPAWHAAPWGID